MNRDFILNWIRYERHRQNNLHPYWDNDKALAVLTEEFLEVVQAIQNSDKQNLKEELVQVASVCVRWLENMKEEEK